MADAAVYEWPAVLRHHCYVPHHTANKKLVQFYSLTKERVIKGEEPCVVDLPL